jgi:hypothetical protein
LKHPLKILVTLFLISQLIQLHSQTERGRLIYGGTGSFTYTPGISFSVSPQFGGFVAKNFAILGFVNVSAHSGLFYGIGPEFRYYAGGEKVKFYVFANSAVGGIYHTPPSNRFGINTSVGPGIAIFAGPNFAMHVSAIAGFQSDPVIATNTYYLGIGTTFNGLFSPKKKE